MSSECVCTEKKIFNCVSLGSHFTLLNLSFVITGMVITTSQGHELDWEIAKIVVHNGDMFHCGV